MKKFFSVAFVAICFLFNHLLAQVHLTYEMMPDNIKYKMDQNKADEKKIWEGIITIYSLNPQGLDESETQQIYLRKRNYPEILDVQFFGSEKAIVTCKGGTGPDLIKRLFSELVSGITNIENRSILQEKKD